jgi:hypothetical protein
MNTPIARSTAKAERIFPSITNELYSLAETPGDLTADQKAALRLLELGNRKFGPLQRLRNRELDGPGKISRLLFHHRMAMQYELEGQTQRADFFWRELQESIRPVYERSETWKAITETLADQEPLAILAEPSELRQRLVAEVLIDTHCAFYNGRAKKPEELVLEDRAFGHFRYVASLLDLTGADFETRRALIVPPAELLLELSKEAKQWASAMQAGALLLKHFPDDARYQDEMAGVCFLSAVDKLSSGTDEWQSRSDAGKLREGINGLEKLLSAYPYNSTIYQMLGHLHHLRAVKLANSGDLSEALVSAQKAMTLHPSEETEQTGQKLVTMMKDLQEQVRKLEWQVASQPNSRLSAEGKRMKKQARRGLQPMNEYVQSAEAKRTSEYLYVARARSVWQSIGLSEPDTDWNERALVLLEGLSQVISKAPADNDEVSTIWRDVSSQDERLAGLDADVVCAFLGRRLFDFSAEPQDADAPARSFPSPADPPILETKAASGKQAGEPFAYWLLSRHNLRLKFQAAVALVLLLTSGALTLRETLAHRSRDAAYRQIVVALNDQRHLNAIEAAESFFANRPLLGEDGREKRVLNYYDEALLRWLVQQDNNNDESVIAHLNHYRQFTAAK